MDLDSIVKIVVGWIVKRLLDWFADQWKAKDTMGDIGLKRGIRRSLAGMIGSVVLCVYAAWVMIGIAVRPAASGGDAVAAALAVGLIIVSAVTYKRRREQWKHCKRMAAGLTHSAPPRA